ncbi:MAG: phosphoribosylpyrophosphate synthetase, partial [Gammaproteobacteria bacterium]
ELRVVESVTLDGGTDPGDDVTMYLIESSGGQKGYLILSDSFHTDPQKAAFIDALLAQSRSKG